MPKIVKGGGTPKAFWKSNLLQNIKKIEGGFKIFEKSLTKPKKSKGGTLTSSGFANARKISGWSRNSNPRPLGSSRQVSTNSL